MQHITSPVKDRYSKSTVTVLPLFDLQPSNETCIDSTLLYVKNQPKYLKVDVPCITFDQPLWYQAKKIISDKNLNMVCCLGVFSYTYEVFFVVLVTTWQFQVMSKL